MDEREKLLLENERRELCRIHTKRLDGIDEKITKVDLALYGNGDPKKGILWIATTNKDTIDWIAKISVGILVVVCSNILTKIVPAFIGFLNHAMK